MGLAPTIVGGAIGALAGVGLHLLVESTTTFEASWFAIIIGLLTGLGVNQANKSLAGRVSYLRGAVAAAIALAAIVASPMVIAKVAAKDNSLPPIVTAPPGANAVAGAEDESEDAASDDTPTAEGERPGQLSASQSARDGADRGSASPALRPADFSVMQFIFMGVGTFIAYELGRGSAKPTVGTPAEEPLAMDPSN